MEKREMLFLAVDDLIERFGEQHVLWAMRDWMSNDELSSFISLMERMWEIEV